MVVVGRVDLGNDITTQKIVEERAKKLGVGIFFEKVENIEETEEGKRIVSFMEVVYKKEEAPVVEYLLGRYKIAITDKTLHS